MTADELAASFVRYAEGVARSRGYDFRDGAFGQIESRFGAAATELAAMPTDVQARMAVEIEAASVRLIEAMIAAAAEIPGYPQYQLGEETWAAALCAICPIWPFCDRKPPGCP